MALAQVRKMFHNRGREKERDVNRKAKQVNQITPYNLLQAQQELIRQSEERDKEAIQAMMKF